MHNSRFPGCGFAGFYCARGLAWNNRQCLADLPRQVMRSRGGATRGSLVACRLQISATCTGERGTLMYNIATPAICTTGTRCKDSLMCSELVILSTMQSKKGWEGSILRRPLPFFRSCFLVAFIFALIHSFFLSHSSTLIAKAYSDHVGCAALAIKILKTFVVPRFEYSTTVL